MTLSVSVVIPTYNRAHLISRAVDSALANMQSGDELIVVDDGSTDDTDKVLSRYGDRIRLVHGRHGGAGAARNLGTQAARGDLVAFLDSDDEWMPNKLPRERALFEARPDLIFSFSNFAVRESDGQEYHRFLVQWHGDNRPWDQILAPSKPFSSVAKLPAGVEDFPLHIGDHYFNVMQADYIAMFTVVVRRVAAGSALYFPEDLAFYEDCETFARLAKLGPAAYLDCELAWNHGHTGERLTRTDSYVKLCSRITFLERIFGQDREFLARYGEQYSHRLAEQYRARARWLLCRGRTQEARADLRRAGSASFADRFLSRLPGFFVRGLLGLRRRLRPAT